MNKSRRVWTAGAAAMLFSSVVGSAAFLTLNSPRADFLPESSVWQNSLLPGMVEGDARYQRAGNNSKNFMNLDFDAYGDAFSYTGGAGGAANVAALNSANGGDAGSIGGGSDSGNGGSADGSRGQGSTSSPVTGTPGQSGAQPGTGIPGPVTFAGAPSASDAVRSELERSIEPPSRSEDGNNDQLAEFDPDETMTPDPDEQLPPIDQQPLPERPVPEPHSLALLLFGIAGLSALRYRRRSA